MGRRFSVLAVPGLVPSGVALPAVVSEQASVPREGALVSGEAESASPSWAQAQGSERALGPEPWLQGVASGAAVWVLEGPGSVRVAQASARAGPRAH